MMDLETMRQADLGPIGFVGFTLYENGFIKRPNGKMILGPYPSGQVCLSRYSYSKHFSLAHLVARFFVENPYGYDHLSFKDGNRLNCTADNIVWVPRRSKRPDGALMPREQVVRPDIIHKHINGIKAKTIAKQLRVPEELVTQVIQEFEEMVRQAPKSPIDQ